VCIIRVRTYTTFPRANTIIIISYGTRKRRRRRQRRSCAIILLSFASSFVSPQETYNIILLYRRDKINGIYILCTHTVRIVSARTHTHTLHTIMYRIRAHKYSRDLVLSCVPTKGLTCSGIWRDRYPPSGFITLDYCWNIYTLYYCTVACLYVMYVFFQKPFLLCAAPRPMPIRIMCAFRGSGIGDNKSSPAWLRTVLPLRPGERP